MSCLTCVGTVIEWALVYEDMPMAYTCANEKISDGTTAYLILNVMLASLHTLLVQTLASGW